MKILAIALLAMLLAPATAVAQALQTPSSDKGRLQADHVRYDSKAKIYLAEGHVRLTLGDVEVRAQRLRLERESQTAYAFAGVTVTQGDIVLTSETLTYDHRREVVSALGDPRLVKGATTVLAGRMEFNLALHQTHARGGVTVRHKDVTVRAPEMRYDGTADYATATDVVVSQPDRIVRARFLRFAPKTGRLELEGQVVVEQLRGERLVAEGVIATPGDDEAKRLLASKTVLTCDRLVILSEQRQVEAEGAVTVTQEGRSAFAAAAVYSDRDQRLIMTGNVTLQEQGGNRLRADRVVISQTDETVEATGNVITEFVLARK